MRALGGLALGRGSQACCVLAASTPCVEHARRIAELQVYDALCRTQDADIADDPRGGMRHFWPRPVAPCRQRLGQSLRALSSTELSLPRVGSRNKAPIGTLLHKERLLSGAVGARSHPGGFSCGMNIRD